MYVRTLNRRKVLRSRRCRLASTAGAGRIPIYFNVSSHPGYLFPPPPLYSQEEGESIRGGSGVGSGRVVDSQLKCFSRARSLTYSLPAFTPPPPPDRFGDGSKSVSLRPAMPLFPTHHTRDFQNDKNKKGKRVAGTLPFRRSTRRNSLPMPADR